MGMTWAAAAGPREVGCGCRRKSMTGRQTLAVLLIGMLLMLSPANAEEIGDKEQDAPRAGSEVPGTADETVRIRYTVTIVGVKQNDLSDLLEASSQLIALKDRPLATLSRLRLRAEEDVQRFGAALRSEGYYEAVVDTKIDDQKEPVPVTVEVATGPRYRLSAYVLTYEGVDLPEPAEQPSLTELGLEIGMPARAPDIVAAEETWAQLMTQRGFPFARVGKRKSVINRDEDTLSVTLAVEPGARAQFGTAIVEGLEKVEEEHVQSLVPWREGESYDSRKIEDLRRRISASGLFSSITVKPAGVVEEDGTLPVDVQLTEAPQRSIGFGASYSTDVGFGGEVFWEHRNLLGRGERLRLNLTGAQIEQSATARFRKPEFLRRDQALLFDLGVGNKNTDAFDEQSVTGFAGIEFPLTEQWRSTVGLAPEYSQVDDDEGKRQFFLLGLPATASRDASDNPLNPTRGTRLDLALTPFYGTGDEELTFLRAVLGGSAYQSIDEDSRFVLAGRARVGALVGESTERIPANKRFYAGGGGSVRGYEFQSIGPLDDDDDPLGGRSLLEVNAELRVRVTDTIGLVPFVDGGTVFDSSYPDFDETFRWAAGLGLRYFTGFGPLRADFAFPLNRRSSDDAFQFYVSIGQAF